MSMLFGKISGRSLAAVGTTGNKYNGLPALFSSRVVGSHMLHDSTLTPSALRRFGASSSPEHDDNDDAGKSKNREDERNCKETGPIIMEPHPNSSVKDNSAEMDTSNDSADAEPLGGPSFGDFGGDCGGGGGGDGGDF